MSVGIYPSEFGLRNAQGVASHCGRVGFAYFPQNIQASASTPNSALAGLRQAESILRLSGYFEARPEVPRHTLSISEPGDTVPPVGWVASRTGRAVRAAGEKSAPPV